MNARKCDRCGSYYEYDVNKKNAREYSAVHKIEVNPLGKYSKTIKNKTMDLCDPCYKEFLAVIKPPRKETKNGKSIKDNK